MSYTVLARKYRPGTFKEIIGQEWISRTLENAIKKERVAHAFLFSGPRGVGKTSMARILAKALNCEEGPTAEPCLKCERCVSIVSGNDMDVVEIDAASNRGIDHIRALRENVRYVPANSRHKIYIIDEVHMLTMESFNALLKTLEEPPEHVKFIFATTEPQKMPETVRSRCQCYEFRRISSSDIAARLENIAVAESIECDTGVLQRIAALSRGGLRDAESLLDQVAALGGGCADFESLNSLTGRLSPSDIADLMDGVLDEDLSMVLDFVDRVYESGTQGEDLLKDLLDYLRALMLVAAGAREDITNSLSGLEERCRQQAERTDLDRILGCLQITLEALRKTRWFDDERVLTEMSLLKMARFSYSMALSDAMRSLGEGGGREDRGAGGAAAGKAGPVAPSPSGADPETGKGSPRNKPAGRKPVSGHPSQPPPGSGKKRESRGSASSVPAGSSLEGETPSAVFSKIVGEVEKRSKSLATILRRLEIISFDGKSFELLDPEEKEGGTVFSLNSKENMKTVDNASKSVFGRQFGFSVKAAPHSGKKEIPPIVRKTIDHFEGDLV